MADDRKVRWFSEIQCLQACVIFIAISSVHGSAADTVACVAVKETYRSKGFDENHVPISAVSGSDLTICPQGKTCCTRSMENNMKLLSSKDHVYKIEKASKLTRKVFASRTRKFDEFFTELMDHAQKKLHEMYLVTYGLGYQQNSIIFTDLFDSLRDYYKGKDKNLKDVMHNFFVSLFRRMLQLLNSDYDINDEYLECATEYMNVLKPFADVPIKLSSHVNRGFIAARTFVQGLAIGRDVVNAVVEVLPSEPCVKAIVRMNHCPLCRGLTSTKPCNNYCLNTMKGCLAHHADLNAVWNEYIDSMESLATKLEGPFNIESVVNPIKLKLSDAIMNMQTSAHAITTKVFAGCGTPRFRGNSTLRAARSKRDSPASASAAAAGAAPVSGSISSGSISSGSISGTGSIPGTGSISGSVSGSHGTRSSSSKGSGSGTGSGSDSDKSSYSQKFLFEMGKQRGGSSSSSDGGGGRGGGGGGGGRGGHDKQSSGLQPPPPPSGGRVGSLHRLVRDIRMKIRQTKDFWINLPHTVCNSDDVADINDNDCWNGHDRAKYIQEVQKDGSLQQINNPEVEVDVTKTNTVIHRQKIQTQLIIGKLRHAIKGEDVGWIDTETDYEVSSGSGSGDYMTDGSGSGYGIITDDASKGFVNLDDSKNGKETHTRGNQRPNKGNQNTRKSWGQDPLDKDPSNGGKQTPTRTERPNKRDDGGSACTPTQAFSFVLLVFSIRGILQHLLS